MNYLPQFFPEYWRTEHNVFGIKFTAEISIGFVERLDGGYSFLSHQEFKELKTDSKKLLAKSIENLKDLFENCDLKVYAIEGGKVGFWNSENDNFTSARILIPEYQKIILNNISENFNGEFVVFAKIQ